LLGCYGNKEIHTPHIDHLANTGTRFLNHFAGAPVPSAGRTALLSGRFSGDNTIDKFLPAAGYTCQTTSGAADAVKFIASQPGAKPFLLVAGFSPYQSDPPARFLAAYAQSKFDTFPQEPLAKNAVRNREMFKPSLVPNLRKMAAATTAFDEEVGSVSDALAQRK